MSSLRERNRVALQHSVEADVSLAFAWRFRTEVANWNDPPATFVIDGPFAAGSLGRTLLPGQEPVHWLIREVRPGKSFVIEMELDRATLSFEWLFQELGAGRTKLTQRIVLTGDNAASYTEQVKAGFGSNLQSGMERIAAEMAAAERLGRNS